MYVLNYIRLLVRFQPIDTYSYSPIIFDSNGLFTIKIQKDNLSHDVYANTYTVINPGDFHIQHVRFAPLKTGYKGKLSVNHLVVSLPDNRRQFHMPTKKMNIKII